MCHLKRGGSNPLASATAPSFAYMRCAELRPAAYPTKLCRLPPPPPKELRTAPTRLTPALTPLGGLYPGPTLRFVAASAWSCIAGESENLVSICVSWLSKAAASCERVGSCSETRNRK